MFFGLRSTCTTTTTKQPLGLQMIGDANLFLKGTPGEDEFEAEVEIMIAGEYYY